MRALAILAFGVAILVNILANQLPLNGVNTAELSARFPNLFVPAGVTFAIWGVIYLLLMAWIIAQFMPRWAATGRRVAPLFAVTSVLNASWLLAWHYGYLVLSVAVMVALLVILLRIGAMLLDEGAALLPRAAFGVYLGWICVATIANVTAVLVGFGWGGAGVPDQVWAILLVLIGAGAGAGTMIRLRNPWVGLALTWALWGIVLNRRADFPAIAGTAGTLSALLGLSSVALLFLWFRLPRPAAG